MFFFFFIPLSPSLPLLPPSLFLPLPEPVFCPYAMTPQSSLRLKVMLQHQPWRLEYNLNPKE